MPDTFVPFMRPAGLAKDSGFAPLPVKIVSQPGSHPASDHACREPVLTFEREGDRIKSIHIKCSCGQMIDLACEY